MLTVLRAAWLADRAASPTTSSPRSARRRAGARCARSRRAASRSLGPLGVSREHLLEKWFRDVRITDIYEGTGQIQRLIIARTILGYDRTQLK